jgi:hypothetical protein
VSIHVRKVASGLRNLADEIAMHDRPVELVGWYNLDHPDKPVDAAPIVPMAIHDALCPSLTAVAQDEDLEQVVCDRCKLAVENGAS